MPLMNWREPLDNITIIEAFLGIDISKNTFDVALLVQDKISSHKFNNTR
jgi:hypothetical protein